MMTRRMKCAGGGGGGGGERERERERALLGTRGGVYSYSSDTVEGPRAPAVKLTARHSSLTRVRK